MEYQEIIMRIDALKNDKALLHVLQERLHQERKWGERNHHPFKWITILMEEVGEFSEAALHADGDEAGHDQRTALQRMRKEAVQVAAVALAIIECHDRNNPSS